MVNTLEVGRYSYNRRRFTLIQTTIMSTLLKDTTNVFIKSSYGRGIVYESMIISKISHNNTFESPATK